jgi:dienelactone hydrolase
MKSHSYSPPSVLLVTVLSLANCDFAVGSEKIVDRVPLPSAEGGRITSLEIVIFKPDGKGPFPAIVFNHGSGGSGKDVARLKQTWINEGLAQFFNERGWLVAFPQRSGRGRSDGVNDEGFLPDRSAYSCAERYALPGLDRAAEDVTAAFNYVFTRTDVDSTRLVVGGQSRGGMLAIAFAGKLPDRPVAVVNFVGGWVGDTCSDAIAINTSAAKQGAAFQGPTLWLYGENDSMYKSAHSRGNFQAFLENGGKGEFVLYSLSAGTDGHRLIDHPSVWAHDLEQFLKALPSARSERGVQSRAPP